MQQRATFTDELDEIAVEVASGMIQLPLRFRKGFQFEMADDVDRIVEVVANELKLPEPERSTPGHFDDWERKRVGPDYGLDHDYVLFLAFCIPAIDRFMAVLPDDQELDLAKRILDQFDLFELCFLRDRLRLRGYHFFENKPDTLGDVEDSIRRTIAPWLKDRLLAAANHPPATRKKSKPKSTKRDREDVRRQRQASGTLGLSA